jgi:hypothetical protein
MHERMTDGKQFYIVSSILNFWISSPSGIAKNAGHLQECKKYQLLYAKKKSAEKMHCIQQSNRYVQLAKGSLIVLAKYPLEKLHAKSDNCMQRRSC